MKNRVPKIGTKQARITDHCVRLEVTSKTSMTFTSFSFAEFFAEKPECDEIVVHGVLFVKEAV